MEVTKRKLEFLLGGGVADFRENTVDQRTPQFDKRVQKNRKRNKLQKASRRRNRR